MSGFMYVGELHSSVPVCTPSRANRITGEYQHTGCDWHADSEDAPALPNRPRPEDIESCQRVRRVEGISEERLARVRLLMAEIDAENGQIAQVRYRLEALPILETPPGELVALELPAGNSNLWRDTDVWIENVKVGR